jgi:hypothetical protein
VSGAEAEPSVLEVTESRVSQVASDLPRIDVGPPPWRSER